MFCSTCGNKLVDGAAFCPVCGAENKFVASVDEPTVGGFESIPVEAVQPAEAAKEYQPIETPVVEPVEVPAEAPKYQSIELPNAPVVEDIPNGKKIKKTTSKKNFVLIGVLACVALAFIAGIVAVVAVFTSPKMTVVRAAKKTLLDSSGFAFEVYETGYGKVGEGKVYFGEGYEDSGFYFSEGDGDYRDEFGYYNNKVYDNWGSYDLKEGIDEINEELDYYGFDITVEDALDRLIDGEINEKVIFEIYDEQYDNLQAFVEDEVGIDIELPTSKMLKSALGDLYKSVSKDAIKFEKDSKKGQKIYKYEVDLEELMVGVLETIAEDGDYDEYISLLEDESGYDIDDLIDEIKDERWPDIDGKIIIEKGYLVEFSFNVEFDGYKDGYRIKFSDINDTKVNQKTMDNIEVYRREDEYYEYY